MRTTVDSNTKTKTKIIGFMERIELGLRDGEQKEERVYRNFGDKKYEAACRPTPEAVIGIDGTILQARRVRDTVTLCRLFVIIVIAIFLIGFCGYPIATIFGSTNDTGVVVDYLVRVLNITYNHNASSYRI